MSFQAKDRSSAKKEKSSKRKLRDDKSVEKGPMGDKDDTIVDALSPNTIERWSKANDDDIHGKKKSKKGKIHKEEINENDIDKDSSDEKEIASSSSSSKKNNKGIFSNQLFTELPITETTQEALASLGFTKMTEIQAKAIPESLVGKDLVGAARTGSGKTLAFLIPIIELLVRTNFTRKQGTGAIIISPTRELSLQIYGVLRDLMEAAKYPHTHGLVMGGANRKSEADKLVKGVNIIVATPGRLLDHLANTKAFTYSRLAVLVIDEADRILEQGFEEDLRQIVKLLPTDRQTLLYSATQTRKVEDLARLSLRDNPVHVGVHDDNTNATVDGLMQGYVVCPAEQRFQLLFTFLKKNKDKKIMVSSILICIYNVFLFLSRIAAAGIFFFLVT